MLYVNKWLQILVNWSLFVILIGQLARKWVNRLVKSLQTQRALHPCLFFGLYIVSIMPFILNFRLPSQYVSDGGNGRSTRVTSRESTTSSRERELLRPPLIGHRRLIYSTQQSWGDDDSFLDLKFAEGPRNEHDSARKFQNEGEVEEIMGLLVIKSGDRFGEKCSPGRKNESNHR